MCGRWGFLNSGVGRDSMAVGGCWVRLWGISSGRGPGEVVEGRRLVVCRASGIPKLRQARRRGLEFATCASRPC